MTATATVCGSSKGSHGHCQCSDCRCHALLCRVPNHEPVTCGAERSVPGAKLCGRCAKECSGTLR